MSIELVRAAGRAGARRFVGIGSQAEYGPSAAPLREDDCLRPATMYGAAKAAAGHLCVALAARLGMSAAWVRAFSIYGPGERANALVPDVVRALAAGAPFPLSSCEQRWDYLYEDDAAEALVLALEAEDVRGFLNLASGDARPLRETVTLLRDRIAPGARLLFSAVPGQPQDLLADTSRVRASLRWAPTVSLEDGLRRTVDALLEKRAW